MHHLEVPDGQVNVALAASAMLEPGIQAVALPVQMESCPNAVSMDSRTADPRPLLRGCKPKAAMPRLLMLFQGQT